MEIIPASNSDVDASATHASPPHFFVSYVTDIEGNWNYWDRFVRISDALVLTESVRPDGSVDRVITLNPGYHLVFGGDVCDRGPGDIRVVRELLALKESNLDTVHFIMGNRDVNKLRLAVELDECMLNSAAKVYWIDATSGGETGLSQFDLAAASGSQNVVDRLKWILKATMGSPGAFEYRREELALLGMPHSDEDVVNHYRNWVAPGTTDAEGNVNNRGELLRFLEHGKIAVILGDTLYVHGALKPINIGWVPPDRGGDPQGSVVQDLREWVDRMNEFHSHEIADYIENFSRYMTILREERRIYTSATSANFDYVLQPWSTEGGYANLMPASRLVQYGIGFLPNHQENPSSLYACYLSKASPAFTAQHISNFMEYTKKNFQRLAPKRPVSNNLRFSQQMNRTKSKMENSLAAEMLSGRHSLHTLGTAVVSLQRMTRASSSAEKSKPKLEPMVSPRFHLSAASVDEACALPTRQFLSEPCSAFSSDSGALGAVSEEGNSGATAVVVNAPNTPASPMHIGGRTPTEEIIRAVGTQQVRCGLFAEGYDDEAAAEAEMNAYILRHNIRRIVVGHQPRGDAPLVLNKNGLQIISADTSYAVNVEWVGKYEKPSTDDTETFFQRLDGLEKPPADSTRGCTVYEIVVTAYLDESLHGEVEISGMLSNGLTYIFQSGNDPEHYVGRQTPSGWYVKLCDVAAIVSSEETRTPPPPPEEGSGAGHEQEHFSLPPSPPSPNIPTEWQSCYLLSLLSGFSVKNRLVPKDAIHAEFA